jgi:PKD repeat protein
VHLRGVVHLPFAALPTLFGVLLLVLLTAAGCDGRRTLVAPTPPQTSAPGNAPEAVFVLAIDKLGSQEALTGVSEITVDASASTGSGLRYAVDFGDGTTVAEAVARHVFNTAGEYRVTVSVTDARGQTATTSRSLVVASAVGTWLYSGYIERARGVEVRTLTLTAQEGLTVRGVLKTLRERESAVTGTLTPDRRIRLAVDRPAEILEGVVPSVLSGDRAVWTLTSRGGLADGEALTYTPRPGEPSGPPPDAVLKMRFFSFSAPFAIKEISPILFDGSTSRGEELTHFIEFGDGQFEVSPTAVHPIAKDGSYTARLTIVDRFGRVDVETAQFFVQSLAIPYAVWFDPVRGYDFFIDIESQSGSAIAGIFQDERGSVPFTGTADGDGSVRLRLIGSGVTLVGTLTFQNDGRLILTYRGGPNNGTTITFHYDIGPG